MSTQPPPLSAWPPEVQLTSPGGASAKISPYGAHLLSWIPVNGVERLFLSPKAEYRHGTAIRGGVPVIFPRFSGTQFAGLGPLPKHGFARTQTWEVAHLTASRAVFWLSESELTRQVWPHRFLAEYSVQLEDSVLEMSLAVTNTDITPFQFTAALHTYLRVKDVRQAAVTGLSGLIYRDSANGEKETREISERVTFPGEVDRIYLQTPSPLQMIDENRTLSIFAEGFPEAVIWNPGPEKSAQLADLGPDGYLQFVCVEAASVTVPILLAPGQNWRGTQKLSI